MKILVKDLEPNPFRRMDRYPIDPHKVEALKISISETSFWDNLLARKAGNKFQLAYGHHRHIALQELKVKEVDIPVRDLDDAVMIQIMANENLDQWKLNVAVINETISVAKDFLDGELAKYETWEDCPRSLIKLLSLDGRHVFQDLKKKGVGQTTLLKFLGKNWKQYQVQNALNTLQSKDVDRAAVEAFETATEAEEFKRTARAVRIPKEDQLRVAKKVAEIRKQKDRHPSGGTTARDFRGNLDKDIEKAAPEYFEGESAKLKKLKAAIDNWQEKVDALRRASTSLEILLQKESVEEIHGISKLFAMDKIHELMIALRPILIKFGLTIK